jgi:hypothetical protein
MTPSFGASVSEWTGERARLQQERPIVNAAGYIHETPSD